VNETKELLLRELQIKLGELEEDWHFSSLEKIFIEKRIYRDIEEETTWEGVLAAIDKGLQPYKKQFRRTITQEDISKLTEIRIKRISKFDAFKADEHIKGVNDTIAEVSNNIELLNDYTIKYYEGILKKYGKGRERKTEIRQFETIQANTVAIANAKLYVNWKEGFVGTGLKKDEFLFDCSDLDQIIVFKKDGKMVVTKVSDKTFVGKDILHVDIFKKNDERTTYNMVYLDGKSGIAYGKRFNVTGITRDKEYDLTKGNPNSKILYFTANPNGEAEIISITLSPGSKARVKNLDFFFETLDIKGRSAGGNQVTKYPIKSIKLKEKGKSTLSALKIWFDPNTGRLNKDENGQLLGRFAEGDKIIAFYKDGSYELTDFELTNRYETADTLLIEKFHPENVIAAIYYDAANNQYYCKRFVIETQTLKNKFLFIKEGKGNELSLVSTHSEPNAIIRSGKKKSEWIEEQIALHEYTEVTGWKAIGKKIAIADIKEIALIPNEENEAESPTLF
jgi:topoisomerase-4 subunit A